MNNTPKQSNIPKIAITEYKGQKWYIDLTNMKAEIIESNGTRRPAMVGKAGANDENLMDVLMYGKILERIA